MNQSEGTPGYGGSAADGTQAGIGSAFGRGKENVSSAANSATSDAASQLEQLRADFNSLKEMVSRLASQVGGEAAKLRDMAHSGASHVSDAAADVTKAGANLASSAADQAKTLASELEDVGRRNPLGAMAAALAVGLLVGLIGRGGRH